MCTCISQYSPGQPKQTQEDYTHMCTHAHTCIAMHTTYIYIDLFQGIGFVGNASAESVGQVLSLETLKQELMLQS